jgi:hypothetical protein
MGLCASSWPALLASLLAVACHNPTPRPPPRASGVPIDAVWAGGVDGGDWLRCVMRGKEPAAFFDCDVYSDQTGHVIASGSYSLARCGPDGQCEPVTSLVPRTDYQFFDGVAIHLRQPYALIPDGDIDYPLGDGHGKRSTYRFGRETSPARAY